MDSNPQGTVPFLDGWMIQSPMESLKYLFNFPGQGTIIFASLPSHRYSTHNVGCSGQSIGLADVCGPPQQLYPYTHVYILFAENHLSSHGNKASQVSDISPDWTILPWHYWQCWCIVDGGTM